MDHSALPTQVITPRLALVSRADFCRFYDAYAPRLYGHLLRQGHRADTAQHLLAQTFARCWHERDQLRMNLPALNAAYPLSWLLRLVQPVATSPSPDPVDGKTDVQAMPSGRLPTPNRHHP